MIVNLGKKPHHNAANHHALDLAFDKIQAIAEGGECLGAAGAEKHNKTKGKQQPNRKDSLTVALVHTLTGHVCK